MSEMIETKGTKYKFKRFIHQIMGHHCLKYIMMIIMVIIMETLFAFLNVQL